MIQTTLLLNLIPRLFQPYPVKANPDDDISGKFFVA